MKNMPGSETLAYMQEDGRVMVRPDLVFDRDAWNNILGVIERFKNLNDLIGVRTEECIEYIMMELAGSIGMETVNDTLSKYVSQIIETNRIVKKVDKSVAMRLYSHEHINGAHHFMVQNPVNEHIYEVKWHGGWNCTCSDFQYRKGLCKHILAARDHLSQMALKEDENGPTQESNSD